MELRLLKPTALIAAVLASACMPGKTGAGCDSPDGPSNGTHRAALSEPIDRESNDEPGDGDVGHVDEDASDRETDRRRPAEDVEKAPPGKRAKPERPWAHNTGPTNVGALVPSGSITISTDGTVVENLDVSGQITVTADNVTIRNFRIDASSSWYGIRNDGKNLLVEDGEVFGSRSAGIVGGNLTARRLYLHDHGGDALKIESNSLVEYCFIEKNGTNADAHADGNQTRGGSNITFRYNNIWMPAPRTPNYPGKPYKSNAAFMLELRISNFVIENNWLNGGTYTVYCPSPEMSGVIVRNNRFGRDYQYGLRAGNCAKWSGNVWHKNGRPAF